MTLSCAVSHMTKTSVYKLQTVGKLRIYRLTISLLTILPMDCSLYHGNTHSRFLLNAGEFLPEYTISQNAALCRNHHQNLISQTTDIMWGKTLQLMINHIPALHLSGKLKESLSVTRLTISYKSVWLFFAKQALKNLKAKHSLLHRNIWQCLSALQCHFSNRQWCNFHNVQQLSMLYSQPGRWFHLAISCDFLRSST